MYHLKWSIFWIMLFSLVGCGFQPRGNIELAPPLKRLYLKTDDPYGQLSKNLTQYLKMSGVYLADNPNDASTILEIKDEIESQNLLSVSGTQQTRQYNLILTVNYRVTTPSGVVLVPLQSATETTSITVQANQILAGSNEAANLYEQMKRAIVFDIMSQLSSKQVTKLVTQKKYHP